MNRRQFIETATLTVAAAATLPSVAAQAEEKAKRVNWPIGCFNRPWIAEKKNWGYDVALDGIKAAGYGLTGLLTRTANEPLLGSDATPDYFAELKKKIASRGLKVNMGAVRTKNDLPLPDQIKDMRQQIDNGKTVGVEFLLTFGVNDAKHFENYYELMADAAAYAQERGLKLVLKPHGGDAHEMLRCLDRVKHPNFKIWFDAGNIIFYTGKDPLEQLKPIVQHVTGFCAKDCPEPKGEVMSQFGTGKVDFKAVFAKLKSVGFNGPIMVEGVKVGATAVETTANARANREFLEKVLSSI